MESTFKSKFWNIIFYALMILIGLTLFITILVVLGKDFLISLKHALLILILAGSLAIIALFTIGLIDEIKRYKADRDN